MLDRVLHDQPAEVRRTVPVLIGARLAGNATYRYTAPFLAVIGTGLGVSLATMGLAVSVGELAGIGAPALGRAIDRSDRRMAMVLGLVGVAGAAILAAVSPSVWVFALALVMLTLSKITYDSSMSAWIGDRVRYEARGRVLGIAETSWALGMLLGVPILGLVTALWSWRLAFIVVAVADLALGVALRHRTTPTPSPARTATHRHLVVTSPMVALFAMLMLLMGGSQCVFVVFGAWLEDRHGFSPATIGVAAVVLGAAELTASAGAALRADRWGKRRSLIAGAAVMAPAAALLGAAGGSAALGLVLLATFVLGFEFALVSALPIVSELDPANRAAAFGMAIGCGTVGRGLASVAATRLYEAHGLVGATLLAAVLGTSALLVAILAVREPDGLADQRESAITNRLVPPV